MKKIFLSLLTSLVFASCTFANEIKKHVKNTSFGIGSNVAVYVLNSDNGKVLYKKNEDKLLNPASLLKLLTFGVSYNILGSDYAFETALYQDNDKNVYVKLGGDVLLKQADLNYLISNLKNIEYKEIYIDDSIFDKLQYPSTWLEEDIWPNQRAISPYIIDDNFVNVAINRSSLAKKVDIIQNDDYKISFINELKIGDRQDVKIAQLYGKDSLIVNLQGSVAEDANLKIPVLRPDINFNVKLNKALDKNNILHSNIIASKKAPLDCKKIAFVGHSIEEVSKLILHNSDNFASEVVFRVAAAKYNNYQKEVSLDDAIIMFGDYYKPYLSKNDVVVDSCGVSRENFLSVKTILNIINKLFSNENYAKLVATSGEGTLADRLLFLNGNLRAKTGTMSNLSALAGTFKTRKDTKILFVSIVQDSKKRKPLLKHYENILVGNIYKNY